MRRDDASDGIACCEELEETCTHARRPQKEQGILVVFRGRMSKSAACMVQFFDGDEAGFLV